MSMANWSVTRTRVLFIVPPMKLPSAIRAYVESEAVRLMPTIGGSEQVADPVPPEDEDDEDDE